METPVPRLDRHRHFRILEDLRKRPAAVRLSHDSKGHQQPLNHRGDGHPDVPKPLNHAITRFEPAKPPAAVVLSSLFSHRQAVCHELPEPHQRSEMFRKNPLLPHRIIGWHTRNARERIPTRCTQLFRRDLPGNRSVASKAAAARPESIAAAANGNCLPRLSLLCATTRAAAVLAKTMFRAAPVTPESTSRITSALSAAEETPQVGDARIRRGPIAPAVHSEASIVPFSTRNSVVRAPQADFVQFVVAADDERANRPQPGQRCRQLFGHATCDRRR